MELAGPLPHEGGLKATTIRNYYSKLKSELARHGVHLSRLPGWDDLEETVAGLLSRPDASPPVDERWDTAQLFDYWQRQPHNHKLDAVTLRQKAASLCMATGLARPSDLARLDARTLKRSSTAVSIRIFRSKNSGAGYSAPITLPFTKPHKRCAAAALVAYIDRTAEMRSDLPPQPHGVVPVFLSTVRPAKVLSADRISNIVKPVLRAIHVSHRVYSTRHNATVDALQGGVPLAVVQKAGRWRSTDVMMNYYAASLDTTAVGTTLQEAKRRKKR
jgi:hypothetical protein